jgi:hypothetical protein
MPPQIALVSLGGLTDEIRGSHHRDEFDLDLIWSRVCQGGVVKRCPRPSPWAPLRSPEAAGVGGDERVGLRRGVSLIFAGWLPQDGLFGVSGTAV